MPEPRRDPSCLACGDSLAGPGFLARDRLHGVAGVFEVRTCPACGSGTTLPFCAPQELMRFYPSGYGPHEDPAHPLVRVVSWSIRSCQTWSALRGFPLGALAGLPCGAAIDVGCGRGDIAAALARQGWRMTGVEPSESAAANARDRGVEVHVGTLADVDLAADAFSAAVLRHSLEHSPDPHGDLVRLHTALRPGALVAITVPNFGSWQARRFRSRWYHLDVPRHRVHLTPGGLRRLLERSGYRTIGWRTNSSAVGMPASFQYAVFDRCLFPDGISLRVASGLCVVVLPVALLADRRGGGGDLLHAVALREA